MAAARTRPAGVLRRHGDEMSTVPRQFVVKLAAEFEPALIEDGLVQAGLGPNLLPRLFGAACRRFGHVPHLQVLDTHHRVVLADRGGALVQVVTAGIADTGALYLASDPVSPPDDFTGVIRVTTWCIVGNGGSATIDLADVVVDPVF